MRIKSLHHIAVICSDYRRSKAFYTEILQFEVNREVYRKERNSYKCDLSLNGTYLIELFSFPDPPERPSYPEAAGLRHLAFEVEDIGAAISYLSERGVACEPVRIDAITQKRFTFFADPDGLPLEFYEN